MMRRLRTNRSDARLALCGEAIERIAEMEVARTPKEATQSKKKKKAKKTAGVDGSLRPLQSEIQSKSNTNTNTKSNTNTNTNTNTNSNSKPQWKANNPNQTLGTQQKPTPQEAEASKPTKKKTKSTADDGFKVVRKGSNAATFAKNAKIAAGISMFYDPYESEEEESGGIGTRESQKQTDQTRLDGEIASSMMMETDEWTG